MKVHYAKVIRTACNRYYLYENKSYTRIKREVTCKNCKPSLKQ